MNAHRFVITCFRCPHTFGCIMYKLALPFVCWNKNWGVFPFIIFQLQLREAHEAIADKDGVMEDNNHMIHLLKHEQEELTRENQVRFHKRRLDSKVRVVILDARLFICISSVRVSRMISRGCADFTLTSKQPPHPPTHHTCSLTPLPHRLTMNGNSWRHLNRPRTCMKP